MLSRGITSYIFLLPLIPCIVVVEVENLPIKGLSNNSQDNRSVENEVKNEVIDLCSNFPIYKHLR